MPPKPKAVAGKKPAAEKIQEPVFEPVLYNTKSLLTSISLLSSTEGEVVKKALHVVTVYADKSSTNVEFLYACGIMPKLLELIEYSDLTIMRYTMKLLAMITTAVNEAPEEFQDPVLLDAALKINHIFVTFSDVLVTEFSSQVLANIVRNEEVVSEILKSRILLKIFEVLKISEDADCLVNTLNLLSTLVNSTEAPEIFPFAKEFSPKPLICFLTHSISQIRKSAINVINKILSWRSSVMQEILKEERIVEVMFDLIMNNDYKKCHKKALLAICRCVSCKETSEYFVKSLEFVTFCEWAKTCPDDYVLPIITILENLSKIYNLRQVLFDFSFEDTLLSFFRVNNPDVFYKTCKALDNMTLHKYCCLKVTPVIVEYLINGLTNDNLEAGVSLTVIYNLMQRNGNATHNIAECKGITRIINCLLESDNDCTNSTLNTLLNIIYTFSSYQLYRAEIMSISVFEKLINIFELEADCSEIALFTLSVLTEDSEFRHLFLERNGSCKILNKIVTTKSPKMFNNVLLYMRKLFVYKKIGLQFLQEGAINTLENMEDNVKETFPIINNILGLMYNLNLPIKFQKLGRLEASEALSNRFYLINGRWFGDIPTLDVLQHQKLSFDYTVLLVDFNIYTTERSQITSLYEEPNLSMSKRKSSVMRGKRRSRTSSVFRKSTTLRESIIVHESIRNRLSDPLQIPCGNMEDPYLPKHVDKLKRLLHIQSYELCFSHKVNILAQYVSDVLSESDCTESMKLHDPYSFQIEDLKQKFGTNIIPIGYLRYGRYCERALLFKALADKVRVPATLVRGKTIQEGELKFWNEVPLTFEDGYKNVDDEKLVHLSYAVVDLMLDIGRLYLIDSVEARKYCGMPI